MTIKNKIRIKFDKTCQICGTKENSTGFFDVDHKDGNKNNNKKSNLWLICPNCHRKKTMIENKKKHFKKESQRLKHTAMVMYKEGMTTREVGKIIKRSHTWVWNIVKNLEKEGVDNNDFTKDLQK